MKTRIYAAPAVKGLKTLLILELGSCDVLALTTLKYVCINHGNQSGFLNMKST